MYSLSSYTYNKEDMIILFKELSRAHNITTAISHISGNGRHHYNDTLPFTPFCN